MYSIDSEKQQLEMVDKIFRQWKDSGEKTKNPLYRVGNSIFEALVETPFTTLSTSKFFPTQKEFGFWDRPNLPLE